MSTTTLNEPIHAELADETLAIHGGAPAVTQSCPPLKRWGMEERDQLAEMIEQPSLFYWNGPQTKLLIERFQGYYPLKYVMPCSSGTAAIHIAIAAAGIGPGDEVITTPITDMGTLIGMLYQGAVPVFADLEPTRYNLDVADVRRKITSKTKAILAVHLAGNPCDLTALRALADEHGLILIEDCAQAWGALHRGVPVGTIGHIGCWSLNDFKHIGCGDGGIVACNDEHFGSNLQRFGDKSYNRAAGQKVPDTLAPNYRISEPQSAVAAVQMTRMWEMTGARAAAGRQLSAELDGVAGVIPHYADSDDRWTAWFYLFRLDFEALTCDRDTFVQALKAEGLMAAPSYLPMPVYKYPVFQNENFFAGQWPTKALGLTDMDYTTVCCPEAEAILDSCIYISLAAVTSEEWVSEAAAAIRKVANYYAVQS